MSAYGGGFALHVVQDYFAGKTVKGLLVDTTFVQDVDNQYLSDLGSGEISGGSYVAGGVAVSSLSVAYDPATDLVHVHGADMHFPALATANVAGVVFYIYTGTPSTSVLLGFDEYSSPVDATGVPLVHQIDPVEGLFTVSVPA